MFETLNSEYKSVSLKSYDYFFTISLLGLFTHIFLFCIYKNNYPVTDPESFVTFPVGSYLQLYLFIIGLMAKNIYVFVPLLFLTRRYLTRQIFIWRLVLRFALIGKATYKSQAVSLR